MMVHKKTGRKEILSWDELKKEQPLDGSQKKQKQEKQSKNKDLRDSPVKKKNSQNKEAKELQALVEKSDVILTQLKTVFPFVFFTDRLIVDLYKVTLEAKLFFFSKRYQTILVENISDVVVDTNLYFATIKVTDRFYAENIIRVSHLPKKQAIAARNIIQGLVICNKHKVDLEKVQAENLSELLEDLGSAEFSVEEFRERL